MGDLPDRHHAPRTGISRRQVVKSGGTLALGVALGSRVQGAFAQATPVTSPEIEAYYTPAAGAYQGTKLTVVMNSGFFNTESSKLAIESLRDQFQQLTGAEVEIVPLPENQMYDQVRLELSTGSGKFDLMHTGAGGAKDYGLSGFLVPLPLATISTVCR